MQTLRYSTHFYRQLNDPESLICWPTMKKCCTRKCCSLSVQCQLLSITIRETRATLKHWKFPTTFCKFLQHQRLWCRRPINRWQILVTSRVTHSSRSISKLRFQVRPERWKTLSNVELKRCHSSPPTRSILSSIRLLQTLKQSQSSSESHPLIHRHTNKSWTSRSMRKCWNIQSVIWLTRTPNFPIHKHYRKQQKLRWKIQSWMKHWKWLTRHRQSNLPGNCTLEPSSIKASSNTLWGSWHQSFSSMQHPENSFVIKSSEFPLKTSRFLCSSAVLNWEATFWWWNFKKTTQTSRWWLKACWATWSMKICDLKKKKRRKRIRTKTKLLRTRPKAFSSKTITLVNAQLQLSSITFHRWATASMTKVWSPWKIESTKKKAKIAKKAPRKSTASFVNFCRDLKLWNRNLRWWKQLWRCQKTKIVNLLPVFWCIPVTAIQFFAGMFTWSLAASWAKFWRETLITTSSSPEVQSRKKFWSLKSFLRWYWKVSVMKSTRL